MSEWGTTPAERLSEYAQRWERIAAERGVRMDELQARAEAAEARCARLQQALRAYDAAFSEWERGGGIWLGAPALRLWRSMAREALAGLGSEQSSLTESGSAGLPDTPADCEHDYVFEQGSLSLYRCDKCGQESYDGVFPRVGNYPLPDDSQED